MTLGEELLRSGGFLFRHRAYLPLSIVILGLLAFAGFRYPAGSQRLDFLWELVCLAVSLMGVGVRVLTIGHVPLDTSGRGTLSPSARTLNTTGMYSIVRNPLYLGNYLMWLGVAMFPRAWYLPIIATLAFWLYYERIILAEEAFLRQRFGADFLSWAASTPAFFPALRKWKRPSLPFSMRAVLVREYYTLPVLAVVFSVFEIVGDFVATGSLELNSFWLFFLTFSGVSFTVLRFLHKRTTLLHLADR